MGNLPTDQSPTVNKGYVPLQVFREYMEQENPSPYTSKFSIAKLVEEWQTRNDALPEPVLSPTIDRLVALEKQLQQTTQSWEVLRLQDDMQLLMAHAFPSFFFPGQMGFIKGPSESHMFRFQSPAMLDLIASDRWEVKVDHDKFLDSNRQNILTAGTSILNTFYNQQVDIYSGEGMVLRDRETHMERHFQFNIRLDYLEIKILKPLKELDRQQIQHLLNNLEDEALWLQCFPPEHFAFEGFVIGVLADVTQPEILSTLKEMAANEGGKSDHEDDRQKLESLVRSYLHLPDLRFGVLQTVPSPLIETLTWCLLRQYDTPLMRRALDDHQTVYGQVMHSGQPVIIDDLRQHADSSELEQALMDQGLRSLLLAPLKNAEGHIIGIFELGSPKPYRFSRLTLIQLKDFVAQIEVGTNIFMQEEEKMQEILPHYFEKFQTDGVEYNIYLGQSLLEEGEFHPFYLRDFRLWQLILMCEITRLVEREAQTFPVPLTTAQLIFVYNNSLSIHFEMDEKQFDVDGAYNVRYEILKKRIDKAYVKGTDERLTQAGKVAIVWLQEEDRQEYQEYLDHLIREGYIRPEIEDLELEKMQGVEGLRAIRVTVVA